MPLVHHIGLKSLISLPAFSVSLVQVPVSLLTCSFPFPTPLPSLLTLMSMKRPSGPLSLWLSMVPGHSTYCVTQVQIQSCYFISPLVSAASGHPDSHGQTSCTAKPVILLSLSFHSLPITFRSVLLLVSECLLFSPPLPVALGLAPVFSPIGIVVRTLNKLLSVWARYRRKPT